MTGLVRAARRSAASFMPENDPARDALVHARLAARSPKPRALRAPRPSSSTPTTRPIPADGRGAARRASTMTNDHLDYALTWYGLALALVGAFGLCGVAPFPPGARVSLFPHAPTPKVPQPAGTKPCASCLHPRRGARDQLHRRAAGRARPRRRPLRAASLAGALARRRSPASRAGRYADVAKAVHGRARRRRDRRRPISAA